MHPRTWLGDICSSHVPWAVRPVLPAYLLIGTASFFSVTFSRKASARVNFQPLMACAVSRVFLKEVLRYEPRARALLAGSMEVAAYRTCITVSIAILHRCMRCCIPFCRCGIVAVVACLWNLHKFRGGSLHASDLWCAGLAHAIRGVSQRDRWSKLSECRPKKFELSSLLCSKSSPPVHAAIDYTTVNNSSFSQWHSHREAVEVASAIVVEEEVVEVVLATVVEEAAGVEHEVEILLRQTRLCCTDVGRGLWRSWWTRWW